jgi:hypothetical protein
MADVEAAYAQKILNFAKRRRKHNIRHDGKTDDLSACLKVVEGAAFWNSVTLNARPARLKKFSSDSAFLYRCLRREGKAPCRARPDPHPVVSERLGISPFPRTERAFQELNRPHGAI